MNVPDSTELLQNVLDAIPVRVFWKDLESRYLGCNTAFARDAGLEHSEQLVALTDFDLGWRDQAELYRSDDRQVMHSGVAKLRYEEPQTTPDGKTIWLRTSKRPLHDARGEIIGVLGSYEDITEYKLLQERAQRQDKLEAIGRLAGGVAHDFNNLLTIIIGNLELMERTLPPTCTRGAPFTGIADATHRAVNLTRQLLAFARKQVMMPQVVCVNDEIRALQGLLLPLLGESVKLELELCPEQSPVSIDPSQFEQLLINLVANARDAMPAGGTLTLRTRQVQLNSEDPVTAGAAQANVELLVMDTGLGMTPEVLSRIFEPFFTTKPASRGTGLGLATCHGIVQQHAGQLSCESKLGRGTTFRILLPRKGVESLPPRAEGELALEGRGRESILLVEDEPAVRRLSAQALEVLGYEVRVAATGAEALQIATELQQSAVLAQHLRGTGVVTERAPAALSALITDVVLPDTRGPALARQLVERFPGLEVLFVSGYAEEMLQAEGGFVPGMNFLPKPYTQQQLVQLLRQALDRDVGRSTPGQSKGK